MLNLSCLGYNRSNISTYNPVRIHQEITKLGVLILIFC